MQTYLKTRGRLLSLAASVGGLFSTVLFRAYLEEIRSYFKIGIFGKHQFLVLLVVFILPILVSYIVLYLVNRLLIWFFGAEDLQDRRRKLLVSLIDAHIFQRQVFYRDDDLLDEYAWTSIKLLWRHK
jgi:hypothetical protein